MSSTKLANDTLTVELDAGVPVVLGYQHRKSGIRMGGAGPGGVIVLNGTPVPWSDWFVTARNEKQAARYDLRHAKNDWHLQFNYKLDGNTLRMTMEVSADPKATLKTVAFRDLPLISCPHTEYIFWRENWIQAPWNEMYPWPEVSAGCYGCRSFLRLLLRNAIPDAAPIPTVHACVFNDQLCCFVKTNYLHMPLLTQTLPSAQYAERSGSFAIQPNTYQYRVRNKTLPPLEAQVVLLDDSNGDGKADESDYHLWLNRSFPTPEPLYKETVWYKIFNARRPGNVGATYKQSLEIIEALYHVTDHFPQMAYLVGWQYEGHDTGYPSLDKLNPILGTREEFLELVRVAKERYNCLISYHANIDDTYMENPGWDESLNCWDVDGKLMPWQIFDGKQSYHLNHTLDVETGSLFKRLDAMLKLVPVEKTIHMDALRYSNHTWKDSGTGAAGEFIGAMEELVCGILPTLEYFKARGIDVSTEALQAFAMDCPGYFSAVWHMDDYWRAQMYHGKILGGGRYAAIGGWGMGAAINRDLDFAMLECEWPVILDYLYLGTFLYLFYAEREMVEFRVPPHQVFMRFADGVRVELEARKEHLQVTWGDLLIASGHDRFIPLKGAIYLYSRDGGERTWKLPEEWRGAPIEVHTLSRSGRQPAPKYTLAKDSLTINLLPRTPVKLMRKS